MTNAVVEAFEVACEKGATRTSGGCGPIFPAATFRIHSGPFKDEFIHIVDLRSEDFGFVVSRFRSGPTAGLQLEQIDINEKGAVTQRLSAAGFSPERQMSVDEILSVLKTPDLQALL